MSKHLAHCEFLSIPESDAGRGVHGIVLEAFGAGNMPVTALLSAALHARKAEYTESASSFSRAPTVLLRRATGC